MVSVSIYWACFAKLVFIEFFTSLQAEGKQTQTTPAHNHGEVSSCLICTGKAPDPAALNRGRVLVNACFSWYPALAKSGDLPRFLLNLCAYGNLKKVARIAPVTGCGCSVGCEVQLQQRQCAPHNQLVAVAAQSHPGGHQQVGRASQTAETRRKGLNESGQRCGGASSVNLSFNFFRGGNPELVCRSNNNSAEESKVDRDENLEKSKFFLDSNSSNFERTEEADEEVFETNWDLEVDKFDNMGLREEVLRGVYGYGFKEPSPIQCKGILPLIQGKDTIAQVSDQINIITRSICLLIIHHPTHFYFLGPIRHRKNWRFHHRRPPKHRHRPKPQCQRALPSTHCVPNS